jgi:flagellar hook-associated protein 1 FlgK
MGDMLSTGVSGLRAFQTALSTISHNIANASTPGYSRQTTQLVTNGADASSNGWTGSGVTVQSVTRSYDQILASQTRSASSGYNQLNTVSTLASSINNMLGDSSTGLSATLTHFTDAVQTLAGSPASTSVRQSVLNQAQILVAQFKSYQGTLSQLDAQVSSSIGTEATTISSLAQSIAKLNQQIVTSQQQTGQPPNDLMDQRDNLIDELATHVNVTTLTQSDGSMNVYIGAGQALVSGDSAFTLSAQPDQYGSGQALVLQSAAGGVDITASLSGGVLGGDLQFRDQMLQSTQNTLGQAAVTLTTLLNQQNAAGLDQNGQIGAALLTVGAPTVQANGHNTGTESVTASVSNLGGLTTSDYYLSYNGSTWTLTDTASGATAALSSSTSGSTTTLTGAGLTLTVTGAPQAGDKFLVKPTSQAVAGLGLLTTDPAKIAAAGPLVTSPGSTNSGSAAIGAATVPSTAAWTRGNYTIAFSSATGFTVTDASGNPVAATVTDANGNVLASGTYSSGDTLSFKGIQVTLTGTPAAGDTFAVNDNVNGTGDNSNALKLAAIASAGVLNGGKQTLSDAVTGLISSVGTQTSLASSGATAQQSLLTSAQTAQSSVSGVNLDEEAANMLKYEQAYQAAAQVIKTAATLFQSLLTAVQQG